MLLETAPGIIVNQIYDRYPSLGPILFFSFTVHKGTVRLDVYIGGQKPLYKSYYHQRFNRACLRRCTSFAKQQGQMYLPYLEFVLLDPLWKFYHFVPAAGEWGDVKSKDHPAQQLIYAESILTTKQAFWSARPDLTEEIVNKAVQLAEASQHRFMDRLLLRQVDGGYDSGVKAYRLALAHQAELTR